MNTQVNYDSETAYSFSQLIEKTRAEYYKSNTIEEKEKILQNYIIDGNLSKNYLESLISVNKAKSKSNMEKEGAINDISSYLENLIYSLDKKQLEDIISHLNNKFKNQTTSEKINFFLNNKPDENIKKIFGIYNKIDKPEINNDLIDEVDQYLDNMTKNIYDINLDNYYFPPLPQFPTYSYNYYSYKILQVLNKFKLNKIKIKFKVDKKSSTNRESKSEYKQYENQDRKWMMYIQINTFCKDIMTLLDKFNYNNIQNAMKILKIITFQLILFENSRNYLELREDFLKIIKCLNSEAVTNDILDKYEFYRKKESEPVCKEDWDKISINEELEIKKPFNITVTIKHFNKNILNLEFIEFFYAIMYPKVEYLNIDGLINYSVIKHNDEIETYSKNLLKYIFSSNKYKKYFKKYDDRFDLKSEEELEEMSEEDKTNLRKNIKIFESVFNGPNKDRIFDEIWDNIFFIPFFGDLSGFNTRNQYSIFVNSKANFHFESSSNRLFPRMHNEINILVHEFSHNIVLLLAANIGENNIETEIIDKDEELIKLQKKYINIYNQNVQIYNEFDDYGDLIEVMFYGIKPNKYKTFSALFCLIKDSYDLEDEQFRNNCADLYNYNGVLNDKKYIKLIIESKTEKDAIKTLKDIQLTDIEILLIKVLNSNFLKLALKSFKLNDYFINDTFEEGGKARLNIYSLFSNDEYYVERNYCDKLDNL